MPETSRLGLPYPQGTDVADVPSDVQVLAEAVDSTAASWSTGIESARPAAGTAGRWYLASDSGVLYLDTGAAWLRMGPPELATPAGTVLWTAAAAAPTGYLAADGAAVSRSTFAALFAAIGTTYGAGDGSTTFNVPDLRGRTAVGAGTGPGLTTRTRGQMFGAETLPAHTHGAGTLATSAAGGHDHLYRSGVGSNSHGVAAGTGNGAPWDPVNSRQTDPVANHTHTITGSTGSTGTGSHGVMQPSIVLTPIIKT